MTSPEWMAFVMNPVAKVMIIGGLVLVVLGLLWHFLGSHLPLGRLPGDIVIERDNVRFYFPIVTSILLSLLLTAILWVISHFRS